MYSQNKCNWCKAHTQAFNIPRHKPSPTTNENTNILYVLGSN